MMKKITFFLTLLVTVVFANVSYAQHSFASIPGPTLVTSGTPVTLNVNDAGNSAAVPASSTGTYSTFSVSVDWTDGSGGPWSSEADLTMTTSSGSVLINPATTGGANDANATTMTFDGTFTLPYDPTVDGFLDIVLNQSWAGSAANWSNIVVTIYESPSCFDPTNLAVDNVTLDSFDLSWVDASGGAQFDFYYVVQPAGTGLPVANPENYFDLSSGVPFTVTCTDFADCANTLLTPSTDYEVYVRADCSANWIGPISFSTSTEVVCGSPTNVTNCYTSGDMTSWTFTSDTGDPLRVTFNAGEVEDGWDELIIYDSDGVTELYNGYGAGGDLTGLTFDSTGDTMTIQITADGSVSCQESGFTSWDFDVACATCVNPTAAFTIVPSCGTSQFSVDVDLTDLGTATSVSISDGTTTLTNISTIGIQSFGPYADASSVSIIITNEQDGSCLLNSGALSYTCPPVNDDLCNAIPLTVGAPATGGDFHLVGASIEANEPTGACWFDGIVENSVWFSFVAPSTDVEVTTDFAGGTLEDGDTQISVYDATGVTCSDLSSLGTDLGCDEDSGDVNTNYGSYVALSGLTAGTTYYIQVDSYDGAALGTFGIQVNDLLSSDDFSANEFVAYPNPVKDVLTLEYSSDITSVRVLNMLGQEVLTRTVNATSTQVDMSKLAAGTYLVNVVSENIQKTIKVVKQ